MARAARRGPRAGAHSVARRARGRRDDAAGGRAFEDAIRQGLERATRTLRGVTAAWIKDQRVKLENNQIAEYQVNIEVTFVLED
jgi:dodecin